MVSKCVSILIGQVVFLRDMYLCVFVWIQFLGRSFRGRKGLAVREESLHDQLAPYCLVSTVIDLFAGRCVGRMTVSRVVVRAAVIVRIVVATVRVGVCAL
jgi:hypothetical protein